MQEREQEIVTKVPFFGDIPLLGWLFKYKSMSKTKTNLLVFLTPHVVTEAEQLGRLSQDKAVEFSQKGKQYAEDELTVTFKDGMTDEAARGVLARQDATVIKTGAGKTYHIKLKKGTDVEKAAAQFSALPEVLKAEPVNRIAIPGY
jgi:Flp pilus assembly secretin CpaC